MSYSSNNAGMRYHHGLSLNHVKRAKCGGTQRSYAVQLDFFGPTKQESFGFGESVRISIYQRTTQILFCRLNFGSRDTVFTI